MIVDGAWIAHGSSPNPRGPHRWFLPRGQGQGDGTRSKNPAPPVGFLNLGNPFAGVRLKKSAAPSARFYVTHATASTMTPHRVQLVRRNGGYVNEYQ